MQSQSPKLPDLSYLTNDQLLEEFEKQKKKAQDLCEPLGNLLRQYQMVRMTLDNFIVECTKRGISVNLDDK